MRRLAKDGPGSHSRRQPAFWIPTARTTEMVTVALDIPGRDRSLSPQGPPPVASRPPCPPRFRSRPAKPGSQASGQGDPLVPSDPSGWIPTARTTEMATVALDIPGRDPSLIPLGHPPAASRPPCPPRFRRRPAKPGSQASGQGDPLVPSGRAPPLRPRPPPCLPLRRPPSGPITPSDQAAHLIPERFKGTSGSRLHAHCQWQRPPNAPAHAPARARARAGLGGACRALGPDKPMLLLLLREGPGGHRPSAPGPPWMFLPPWGWLLLLLSAQTWRPPGVEPWLPVPDPQGIRTPRSVPRAIPGASQVAVAGGRGALRIRVPLGGGQEAGPPLPSRLCLPCHSIRGPRFAGAHRIPNEFRLMAVEHHGEAQRAPARVSEAPGSGREPTRGSILARTALQDTREDTLLWSGAQNPSHAPQVRARPQSGLSERPASPRGLRASKHQGRRWRRDPRAPALGSTARSTSRDQRTEGSRAPGPSPRPGLHLWTAPAGGATPTHAHVLQDPGRSQPMGTPGQRKHCSSPFPSIGPQATVDTSQSHPRHPDDGTLMPGALERPETASSFRITPISQNCNSIKTVNYQHFHHLGGVPEDLGAFFFQTNQAERPAATQMGRRGNEERGRRNPGIRGPTHSHRETLPGPLAGRRGPRGATTTLALLPAPGHRTEAAVPSRRSRTTSLAPKPHPGPPRPPAPPSRPGCQPPPAQVAHRARAAYTLGVKEGPRARKGHPNPAPSPGSPPGRERKGRKTKAKGPTWRRQHTVGKDPVVPRMAVLGHVGATVASLVPNRKPPLALKLELRFTVPGSR
ncbi:basic proline-rich protein-like [Meles meles]|uniref:basic proline-rich protein-like n=1 Tax=Meles meles TaxID=9662 RepID=UPI001E69AFAF|nr:basic proline-rich protein-like [Meles meles]